MKKTLLLADDDPAVRKLYKTRFENEPFYVIFAQDGEEALDLIYKKKPDLIFLDIMMPKKTGIEVLEQIKKDPTVADISVGILTVLDEQEIQQKAFDLGAKYYLVKSKVMPLEVVNIIF